MKNLAEIAEKYLKENGYSGLYDDSGECGCILGELMPCGEPQLNCKAGYKGPPNEEQEWDFTVGPNKEGEKRMVKFEEAFRLTMRHEGGYVDDPTDRGGETYRGISRIHNQYWTGWNLIDLSKIDFEERGGNGKLDYELADDDILQSLVKSFYKANYWDSIMGDGLADQAMANEMFDIAVNMGVRIAVKYLQRALNLLNKNERLWKDLVEDGKMGPKTLHVANISSIPAHPAIKLMNIFKGMQYISLMKKDPKQERFARGWLSRVNIT